MPLHRRCIKNYLSKIIKYGIVTSEFFGKLLTHSFPVHPFSTPWKHQKTLWCIGNEWVKSFLSGKLPSDVKTASISPLDKHTNNKHSISNFLPVSVLSPCWEIFFQKCKRNDHVSPGEKYSNQHILIQILEKRTLYLDSKCFIGDAITNLSKDFNCLPRILLIAKLAVYGFVTYAFRYVYSYLKNRKRCAKINNMYSDLLDIILGVPQRSIVGLKPFNIFFNEFLYFAFMAFAQDTS